MPPSDPLILIADDDEDDRYLIEIAAKRLSFRGQMRFARDGAELTDYLSGCRTNGTAPLPVPDLILLDLNMPRKNGWEVLKEMAQGAFVPVPVVVWTTSADQKDREKCLRLGARDFVTKRTTLDDLVRSLGRVLAMNGLASSGSGETEHQSPTPREARF
jgi:CheY-like chemotaxis protein